MALTVSEAIRKLETGGTARVVGDPGGEFAIAIHYDDKATMVASDDGKRPRYFPSLNHAADWLRHRDVRSFTVDISNWKQDDTGRARSAAKP